MEGHYYSLNNYLREKYGEKVYKLALNGGMTCPNRDGTLGTGGCIFCSAGGSGDFAENTLSYAGHDTICVDQDRILYSLEIAKQRLSQKQTGNKYIAYFQAYTNTYASAEYLRSLYLPVLQQEEIVGLSIGTRPDCLPEEVLDLLCELNQIKPVWIELGLQTKHDRTAQLIRRGYDLVCFEQAVKKLRERRIEVIVHLIFGLPGEGRDDMMDSVRYVNHHDVQGVKFQLLHVLKHTYLGDLYASDMPELLTKEQSDIRNMLHILTMEEYIDIICDAITHLSPEIVIHRLTGDGPKNLILAPMWSTDKKSVLNTLQKEMKLRQIRQGSLFDIP